MQSSHLLGAAGISFLTSGGFSSLIGQLDPEDILQADRSRPSVATVEGGSQQDPLCQPR